MKTDLMLKLYVDNSIEVKNKGFDLWNEAVKEFFDLGSKPKLLGPGYVRFDFYKTVPGFFDPEILKVKDITYKKSCSTYRLPHGGIVAEETMCGIKNSKRLVSRLDARYYTIDEIEDLLRRLRDIVLTMKDLGYTAYLNENRIENVLRLD